MVKTRTFRLRVAAALAGLLLLVAGCLAPGAMTGSHPRPSPERSDAVAQVETPAGQVLGDRLTVVDLGAPQTHIRVLKAGGTDYEPERPFGYISPDGATLYAVEEARDKTILRAFDLATGHQLRQTTLDGQFFVPSETTSQPQLAISLDGRRMILGQTAADAELKSWLKTGRPRSRFVVLDTDFAQPPKLLDLDGTFWFDALSHDGSFLYLIEVQDPYPMSYSPEKAPHYQVRAYDVDRGRLLPDPVVDKGELEPMSGYLRASAYSLDGEWLYGLYTRPGGGPFIHALNLANQHAIGIDLPFPPDPNWETEMLWAVALSGDGHMLYAINGATGQVAQVSTTDGYVIRQSATLQLSAEPRAARPDLLSRIVRWLSPVAEAKTVRVPGAVVAPGGKTLFALGDKGLLVIDTDGLSLRHRYLPATELNSLILSPDGERLYTVQGIPPNPSRLVAVNANTGALLGEVGNVSQPWAVLRADR